MLFEKKKKTLLKKILENNLTRPYLYFILVCLGQILNLFHIKPGLDLDLDQQVTGSSRSTWMSFMPWSQHHYPGEVFFPQLQWIGECYGNEAK